MRDGPIVKLLLELAWRRPEQGFRQVVQAAASPGPRVESQTGLSHLLQPETEQKTERQKTFANKMSCTAGGA